MILREDRIAGGKTQSREAKSLGARNAAVKKPLSSHERIVYQLVEAVGFRPHVILETEIRPMEIDFVLFGREKPLVGIEVSVKKSEVKGESMAFKAIQLKRSFPEIKLVAVVSEKMPLAGLKALESAFDSVVFIESAQLVLDALGNLGFVSPIPQAVDKSSNPQANSSEKCFL